MRLLAVLCWFQWLGLGTPAFAVEAVSELPNPRCEEVQLKKPLQVYVDPALYASNPSLMEMDPANGLATSHTQDPRLSLFTGVFRMKRMSRPQVYRGFRTVARLYGLEEAAKAIPLEKKRGARKPDAASDNLADVAIRIQICGDDAYAGTPGLVFLRDLDEASKDPQQKNGGMPPSVNSIPNPNDYPASRNL